MTGVWFDELRLEPVVFVVTAVELDELKPVLGHMGIELDEVEPDVFEELVGGVLE